MVKTKGILTVPAIEVKQGPERKLYSFALDGKLVHSIATVSRIKRAEGTLQGYQRPEILSHVAEIRGYLESESPMIPNAVVLAFDSRVSFEAAENNVSSEYTRAGTLTIPVEPDVPDEEKPGFIVDGQQRLAAIRDADVEHFPILVTAFITDDVKIQTEQFMLVNSTKPLPKSLIYELLPTTDTRLPAFLERRKLPAFLMERMNLDESSPMFKKIKTTTNPEGIIKDNSILRMLENSLSDGALYRYRDVEEETRNSDKMLSVLNAFWGATEEVFDDAWGLPSRQSRLMHGAGIVSMGFVMDAIADRRVDVPAPTKEHFQEDLEPLKNVCRWTHGYWDFGPGAQRKWNEIQNTPKDVQLLSNYLLVQYKQKVWSAEKSTA